MRGQAVKEFRRQAGKVATKTVETLQPSILAALKNEQLTRERVQVLEAKLKVTIEAVESLEALRGRGLRARLRWLIKGT